MARPDGLYVKFQNFGLDEFVERGLNNIIHEATGEQDYQVENRTQLPSKYDFTLKFAASSKVTVAPRVRGTEPTEEAAAPDMASTSGGLPTLFQALEQQLGLRLVKVPSVQVDVVVIDHIDSQPVEN